MKFPLTIVVVARVLESDAVPVDRIRTRLVGVDLVVLNAVIESVVEEDRMSHDVANVTGVDF